MTTPQRENGSIFSWLFPNVANEVSFCSLNTELQNDTKIARFGLLHKKIQATCLYGTFFMAHVVMGHSLWHMSFRHLSLWHIFSSHVFMAHFVSVHSFRCL